MILCRATIAAFTLTACQAGAVEIETHRVSFLWLRTSHEGPLFFSASGAIPQFDDWNGTRRLGRIRMLYTIDWETEVALMNTLPERQCMYYSLYTCAAYIGSSALSMQGPLIDLGGAFGGRLGADPGQTASRTHTESGGGSFEWTLRDDEFYLLSAIGTGVITFFGDAGTGFDTFRIQDAEHDCSGGYWQGQPDIFLNAHARFRCDATFEYHWIDADCPVDLTTYANPAGHLYGIPDGIIDAEDFFYFLDQFAAGNLAVADLTTTALVGSPGYAIPNGVINNDDFFYFLSLFAAGC